MALFAIIGTTWLVISKAATPFIGVESETGTLNGCATRVSDASASGGAAVQFGGSGCDQTSTAGAALPISYSLTSLTGTARYVATNGSDTSGTGSLSAPYATLAKAYSSAAANDSIVIRGGTYRQGNVATVVTKPVKFIAYPGEIPIFNGSQAVTSGWISEGTLKYVAYTPQPVTDGSGISFSTGQNLTGDGVGKYPDQAWSGATQLRQVSAKSAIDSSTFWVDQANKRLYMTADRVNQGGVEISQKDIFLDVKSPNTTVEGLRITRFSNTASDYGVVKFQDTADNSLMRNVDVSDTAFIAVMYIGSSNLHSGSTMQNVTIESSNWMGVSATYTDDLTLDSVKIRNMNQFNEFSTSPQSGALKTSRTRRTKVLNSDISNNKSHGLWFDQSNVDVDVANNQILDNTGTGLFFEISDDLLLINNYIRATGGAQAVKLSASSGLKLVNNTIIGGGDPIGIYTDSRSMPGCADTSQPLCANSYSSDRDSVRVRPATLDWIPRLDLMINNIVGYPTANKYCGSATDLCITQSNSSASVPLSTVIHKANPSLGVPQTTMNGNVYANGSARLISTQTTSYTTLADFTSAMAGTPVGIGGLEASGRSGNSWVNADGSPTAALAAVHSQAIPIPSNTNVNQYLSAGTRHYGVTTK